MPSTKTRQTVLINLSLTLFLLYICTMWLEKDNPFFVSRVIQPKSFFIAGLWSLLGIIAIPMALTIVGFIQRYALLFQSMFNYVALPMMLFCFSYIFLPTTSLLVKFIISACLTIAIEISWISTKQHEEFSN